MSLKECKRIYKSCPSEIYALYTTVGIVLGGIFWSTCIPKIISFVF